VVWGTQVDAGFMRAGPTTPALRPDPSTIQGGHATILTGVQTVAGRMQFLLRNSWGTSWGKNGHIWLDQDYVTWPYATDFWSMTRMAPLM